MTTRSLTAVKVDGEYKIAQYGHYDGYPLGQGIYVLKFLLEDMKKDKFLKRLKELEFIKDEEESEQLFEKHFKYDGANILKYIQNSKEKYVVDNFIIVTNNLYCQWAYLIDFDTNTFEIYSKYRESKKYSNLQQRQEFKSLNLIMVYQLDKLPTIKEFEDRFDF